MKAENIKIIKGLIKKFGKDAAIDKIQEESQELGLALHQLKCPTKLDKKKLLNDVYGELADMTIALRSAKLLFNEKKINRIVNQKLKKKKEKYLMPLKPAPKTITNEQSSKARSGKNNDGSRANV